MNPLVADGLNRAMSVHGLFGQSDEMHEIQTGLGLDDGTGLRVVSARFLDEEKFDWDLFDGYECMRVLTYSASISAIIRMLDNYSFTRFECIFGYEGILHDIRDILAFQKVAVGDTRAAIMGLKDERHIHVLEKVRAGVASFRVLRKHIAHAKLFLLSNPDGHTRVIIGSANLSERAFSGDQAETLVKYFAYLDGKNDFFIARKKPHYDPEMLEAGRLLVSNQYFSCFMCHPQGAKVPAGPKSMWGPNLSMIPERIRPDFIPPWIQDPGQFTPGVRMPAFLPEPGAGPPNILEGDIDRQAEAIRDYLMSTAK